MTGQAPYMFQVKTSEQVIIARLAGVWTLNDDLEYITQLSEHISAFNRKRWGLFVDMRDWVLPEEVFESPFKSRILLDRRNQVAESWLVNELNQGEQLLPFFRETKIVPFRTLSRTEALNYLKHKGLQFDEV